jgi:SWI/SNF-related matrix-associated actin-dependent regulator 1 of chromatin subfamily A
MDLFPFQANEAVPFLVKRPRAYLALDCGLGKTVVATVAAREVGAQRTLVIAPASALANWEHDWLVWRGSGELVAESYDMLIRHPTRFDGGGWDVVILDEAHYVKNPRAQRTKAALRIAREGKQAWLLSATPAPNHAGELYAPIKALWPGVLRQLGITNSMQWMNRFTHWGPGFQGRGIKVWGSRNGDQLKPFLDRLMLVRKLEDVKADVPPLRVDVFRFPHDERFARAIGEMGASALLRGMEAEECDGGSVSRLRRYLGEYKAPHIADLLAEELEVGAYKKIVVLAYHLSVIDILRRRLERFGVVTLTGADSRSRRKAAEDDFRRGMPRVFIGQQSAAGVALNLQVASEIVLVEPSWVPDDNWQAIKRVHRIVSKHPCRARLFSVKGTLDDAIITTAARKTRTKAGFGL